jgi:hypothetical protein
MKIIDRIKANPAITGLTSGIVTGVGVVTTTAFVAPTAIITSTVIGGITIVGSTVMGIMVDKDRKLKPAEEAAVEKPKPEVEAKPAKPAKPEVAEVQVSAELPDVLKVQVQRLRKIAKLHANINSPMLEHVNGILLDSQELFNRILAKQDSQAHRLAAVNYTDTLSKLNRALDSDYYLDIKKNPRLWSNPEQRIEAVERAVMATQKQLVHNIQQVNASQDIEYEISLESLTNSMNSVSATDLSK